MRWAIPALMLAACTPAELHDRVERFEVKLPAPTMRMSYPVSHFAGLPWCVGGSALIKMARVERRLTNGETWTIVGSCMVPVVGGYIVRHAWGDSPAWNEYPIDLNGPIAEVPAHMRRD